MGPADMRIGAAQDDGRERFERCFRDHYAQVLAFSMRRVPGREVAEDAASETFAVAWRRRELIPDQALPWLYAIAVRVIANQRRAAGRRRNLDARLAHEAGARDAALDPVDALGRRDAFTIAFGCLSESEREVLRLVAWDGLGTRDAAAVHGCSPGAFRVRLHRARRKLAKQLEASGHLPVEPSTATPTPAEEIN
jgi:RNA polymerase sigma-70 factor (ECF subfamily)